MTTPQYAVLTTNVSVPGARRSYAAQRVALIEVEPGFRGTPSAISTRVAGVRRVVRDFGTGQQAVIAAEQLKARLESAH
jgi:hypothetical protein